MTEAISSTVTANMGHPLSETLYQALLAVYAARTTVPDESMQNDIASTLEQYQDAISEQADLQRYRLAAQDHTLISEGTLEVDDHAIVSKGSDSNAAYVQAWLWVDTPEEDGNPAVITPPSNTYQLGHRQNHVVYDILCKLQALETLPDTLRNLITPACTAFSEALARQTPLTLYRDAGELSSLLEDGTLEMDDGATVSLSDKPDTTGAYVQTWLWVELDD